MMDKWVVTCRQITSCVKVTSHKGFTSLWCTALSGAESVCHPWFYLSAEEGRHSGAPSPSSSAELNHLLFAKILKKTTCGYVFPLIYLIYDCPQEEKQQLWFICSNLTHFGFRGKKSARSVHPAASSLQVQRYATREHPPRLLFVLTEAHTTHTFNLEGPVAVWSPGGSSRLTAEFSFVPLCKCVVKKHWRTELARGYRTKTPCFHF